MTSPSITQTNAPTLATSPAARAAGPGYWQQLGQNWLLVLGHLGLLVALYTMLSSFGVLQQVPDAQNSLVKWDAGWYRSVALQGYVYEGENAQNNVAFFPLFPYLWRVSGLGGLGISLFNMLAGATGISLLATTLQFSRRQTLLLASLPLLMYTLVPYTEGLFYLFSAVLLVGLHRQQTGLLLLGLLGCCLTRSAAVLLLPALVFAELISWLETRNLRQALRNVGLGLLLAVAAIGGVTWMQYKQTGIWLAFYTAHAAWGQHWQWPRLPLDTSAGLPMLWLEGLSLGTALLSLLFGIYLFVSRLSRRQPLAPKLGASRPTSFALVYCVLSVGYTLFQQGGDIVGSSRYVLATPFFAVLLWEAWQRANWWGSWVTLAGVLLVAALLLGFPNHIDGLLPHEAVVYFGLQAVYAALLLAAGSLSFRLAGLRELSGALYCLNLLLMSMLLNWFMQTIWLA